ncbi:MAG: ABC transporter ATP-binding protein [Bdellovibrionota bacterium]
MAGEQHTPAIEVRGLSRFFGRTVALDNVSFTAAPGEAFFCLGGNGAGKSTLLSILAGVLAPTEGELRLLGEQARRRGPALRSAIGYAGAQPQLYKDFSIEESLLFFAAMYGVDRKEARTNELITDFGLDAHRNKRLKECSQGIIRKAALARALLHFPKLLLLDEPFTHLDVAAKRDLLVVLRKQKAFGTTLVVSSHEEDLVQALADRAILLRDGRVVRSLSRGELAGFSFEAVVGADSC